jgi:hypothetical protein
MAITLSCLLDRRAVEGERPQPPAGGGHQRRAAGASAACLVVEPVGEPDAANRRVGFDLMISIWYAAMVGFMAAAVIPPFPESRSSRSRDEG